MSDVAITGEREIRCRAVPLSGFVPTVEAAQVHSIVDQAGVAMPHSPSNIDHAISTPSVSPLSKEQVRLIVSGAKGRLQRMILCETPFPSTAKMDTLAQHALDTSINSVLQGTRINGIFLSVFIH